MPKFRSPTTMRELASQALAEAVIQGDVERARRELAQGANPDTECPRSREPVLSVAIRKRDMAMVDALVSGGAYALAGQSARTRARALGLSSTKPSPLVLAIDLDQKAAFERLLDANPKLALPEASVWVEGQHTPVWAAAIRRGRSAWVSGLIERCRRATPDFSLPMAPAMAIVSASLSTIPKRVLTQLAEIAVEPLAFAEQAAALLTYQGRLNPSSERNTRRSHAVARWALGRGALLEEAVLDPAAYSNKKRPSSTLVHLLRTQRSPPETDAVLAWARARGSVAPLPALDRAVRAAGEEQQAGVLDALLACRAQRQDGLSPMTAGLHEQKPADEWPLPMFTSWLMGDRNDGALVTCQRWAAAPFDAQARLPDGRSMLAAFLDTVALKTPERGQRGTRESGDELVEAVCRALVLAGNDPRECPVPMMPGQTTLDRFGRWAPAAHRHWQQARLGETVAATAPRSRANRL